MVTKFSVQDNPAEIAKRYFELELPCPATSLKGAFRQKAKLLHTDTSGKNSKDAFIEMKAAYDFLTEYVQFVASSDGDESLGSVTIEGVPLSQFGLGLGPTTNGRDCNRCNHAGYTKEFTYSWEPCKACAFGSQTVLGVCRYCKGTGKFTQRHSRREVTCRVCHGSGKFRQSLTCNVCFGTRQVRSSVQKTFYSKCFKCKGTGEIPVWNPVILKGRLWR